MILSGIFLPVFIHLHATCLIGYPLSQHNPLKVIKIGLRNPTSVVVEESKKLGIQTPRSTNLPVESQVSIQPTHTVPLRI